MIDPDYKHLLRAWGIQFSELDASVLIEGSPERTAARAVVRDSSGNRWILEQIKTNQFWPPNPKPKHENYDPLLLKKSLEQTTKELKV